MIKAIFAAFQELFGFSKQIAENQGAKIPMKETKITAEAEKDAAEIKENSKKDDWIPKVHFYNKCLSFRWQKHAVNQVNHLIDAGNIITAVGLEKEESGEYFLYIRYIQGLCSTYYKVPVNQKKADLFL